MKASNVVESAMKTSKIDWMSVSEKDMLAITELQLTADDVMLSEIRLSTAASARFVSLLLTMSAMCIAMFFGASTRSIFTVGIIVQVALYLIDVIASFGMKQLKKQTEQLVATEIDRLARLYPRS